MIIISYTYNVLNDTLSAYKIHNNLKTTFSKYYTYRIDSSTLLSVLLT